MAVPPVHRLEYWRTHNIVLQPQHVGSYRKKVLGARIILDQHLPNCPLVLTSQLDMREQCLLRDRGSPQDGEQTEFEGAVVDTGDCALLKPWNLRQPAIVVPCLLEILLVSIVQQTFAILAKQGLAMTLLYELDLSSRPHVLMKDMLLVVKRDRKSTRLNSSHSQISYAVFCLKKKKQTSGRSTVI